MPPRMARRSPRKLLAQGTHAGFDWFVMHNNSGYRNGYVAVPRGHPWHGRGYEGIDVAIHGGLTYADRGDQTDKCERDADWWYLGFDCAHSGDAPDLSLMSEELKSILADLTAYEYGAVRTQEYVEQECRILCEQASVAMQPNALAPADG